MQQNCRENGGVDTRSSLLLRMRDLDDEPSWRAFYEIYGGLLYNVSRKTGYSSEDAEDISQQTLLTVAKKLPSFRYNREKGSFKGWLMRVLRSRMIDHSRKVRRRVSTVSMEDYSMECQGPDDFELLWDSEWGERLVRIALGRLKQRVAAKQFQIFDAYMIKEWSMEEVMETLGVSQRQVYMAKYRVGAKFREELEAAQMENGAESDARICGKS